MELLSTSVLHAIVDELHRWIPTTIIMRPDGRGGLRPETLSVNVFTEMDDTDLITGAFLNPNNPQTYPYLFVEILDSPAIGYRRSGHSKVYTHDYFINVRYYINQDPFNREQIPRLNEELSAMELKLRRVLAEIEIFESLYPTTNYRGPTQNGLLHVFFNLEITERTIPEEFETFETSRINIELEDDQDE